MSKGFWKGVGYSFLGALPLYLLLNLGFGILKRSGIIHPGGNNVIYILGVYAVVLLIYIPAVIFYFKRKSAQNLEKLRKEVEEITRSESNG